MSVVVPYYNFNHIVCNSILPNYRIPNNLTFTLENYIKSQLHFPMVAYDEGRSVIDYNSALAVVEKRKLSQENIDRFFRVVRFFYEDIARSISNSMELYKTDNFNFYIQSKFTDLLPVEIIESNNLKDYVSEFSDGKDEWELKVDILLKHAKSNDIKLIEMR
ncbi:hypothetical protein D3C81_932590 [compost metagenome]